MNLEELKKLREKYFNRIMIYMGPYIKDREEGKYNDYITYDGDLRANYKSYIDLKTGEIYNIDIDECHNFESRNIILNIPVSVNSYDSYLSNYLKVKKWFFEQKESGRQEEAIKELRNKYEKKVDINNLNQMREEVESLESELSEINKKRDELFGNLNRVQNRCRHEVVVKTSKYGLFYEIGYKPNEATCLICNAHFNNHSVIFDDKFKNIIHFEDEKYNELAKKEKASLALTIFKEEREKNPESSDSEIVDIINNRIQNEEIKKLGYCPKNN